eukprot:5068265-Karenia_brevis.AAC.1
MLAHVGSKLVDLALWLERHHAVCCRAHELTCLRWAGGHSWYMRSQGWSSKKGGIRPKQVHEMAKYGL